ncbi:MAG: diguanylate cyclase, partial [Desulfobulbaceae bacterium]|nr:diguanylate cyclase [Desulfobulbaceae bacterium]
NKKTGKQVLDTSRNVMRTLMDHHWPGNVRELENAIEHAFVLCKSDRLELKDLPIEIRHAAKGQTVVAQKLPRQTTNRASKPRELNREKLLELLADCGWNKAEAGRRAGVSRTAIWKYMKKWDIPLQSDQ